MSTSILNTILHSRTMLALTVIGAIILIPIVWEVLLRPLIVRPLIFVSFVVAALVAFVVIRGPLPVKSETREEETTAKTIARQLFPEGWKLTQWFRLNADGDAAEEHLLIFRYNYRSGGKNEPDEGPLGGVIYDSVNFPTSGEPTKSGELLPGMLLPDMANGKGQGYLGETRVVPFLCKAGDGLPEIVLFGFGGVPYPTFLSIFRWDGKRYAVLGHWIGGGGITVSPAKLTPSSDTKLTDVPLGCDSVVKEVAVRTRLNDRDFLCKKVVYRRGKAGETFRPGDPSIVFCYGAPKHPFYPEGAVAAFYETMQEKGFAEAQKAYMDEEGRNAWKRLSKKYPVKDHGKVRLVSLRHPSDFLPGVSGNGVLVTVTVKVNTGAGAYQADWGVAGRYENPNDPKKFVEWRLHSVELH